MREGSLYEWLALSFVPGIGAIHYRQLLNRFKTPERVFSASHSELCEVEGIGASHAMAIKGFHDDERVKRELRMIESHGVTVLTLNDPRYPENLIRIPNAPPLIYVKGEIIPEDRMAIAIVGSRMASQYGRTVTFRLARDLAQQGITIVSGMARGIDSFAHQGALSAKGRTIAVLGCGVDVIYPSSNRGLYQEIVSKGAVISELPMGSEPDAGNFPKRNRLISGISLGVAVVEAGQKSGSLITARHALDQNREVFAVPGNINSPKSRGTHFLIKQGAKLVESAMDILEDIAPQIAREMGWGKPQIQPKEISGLDEDERALLEIIEFNPIHIDQIISMTSLSPAKVSSLLLNLELKGIVNQLPGKWFVRSDLIS
jgi:DNA processing protein